MVTINLMLILKIFSLIILGICGFSFICHTIKNPENIHFVTILIGFLVFALPFIYIFIN